MLTEIEHWFGREVAALPPGVQQGIQTRAGDAPGERQASFRRVGRSDGNRGRDGRREDLGRCEGSHNRFGRKAGQGWGAAAAGPLLGRAAGFIVVAAAGVGVDIALRELGELLSRNELEQTLTTLVDEGEEGEGGAGWCG